MFLIPPRCCGSNRRRALISALIASASALIVGFATMASERHKRGADGEAFPWMLASIGLAAVMLAVVGAWGFVRWRKSQE